VTDFQLQPAGTLDDAALAAVFTAGYEGYWFPIEIDGAGFNRMVRTADADLDMSRVALIDGTPVGVTLIARRGSVGWVGGMGVAAGHRRAGIGEAMLRSALDAARDAGVVRIALEVLEQNAPARALYERLGFVHVRDLEVWSIDGDPHADVQGSVAEVDDALAWVAARRTSSEPWQRADATVSHHRALGEPVEAITLGREEERAAAAIVRRVDNRCSVLQAAAADPDAARELVDAVRAGVASALWINLPADDAFRDPVLAAAGAPAARQLELSIAL
jgi:ribosomal protein S18 acetylase RimI-like enzyme